MARSDVVFNLAMDFTTQRINIPVPLVEFCQKDYGLAIFLSQLLYYDKGIVKSDSDWSDTIYMNANEIERLRRKLVKKGYIEARTIKKEPVKTISYKIAEKLYDELSRFFTQKYHSPVLS